VAVWQVTVAVAVDGWYFGSGSVAVCQAVVWQVAVRQLGCVAVGH
jgi:hypothetical protein